MDYPAALSEWAACLVVAIAISGCATATRRQPANDYGVSACPERAADALLSVDALQCWFFARHGRWRILEHESHVDVLVLQAEALDLRDAEEIARRVVAREGQAFAEILVYVHAEGQRERGRIRRVQWTRESGFSTFDFDGASAWNGG